MTEVCIECGQPMDTEDNLCFCTKCEEKIMADPEFWLAYFHFCDVPANLEQIKKWMGAQ
jgi:hypothetical protein